MCSQPPLLTEHSSKSVQRGRQIWHVCTHQLVQLVAGMRTKQKGTHVTTTAKLLCTSIFGNKRSGHGLKLTWNCRRLSIWMDYVDIGWLVNIKQVRQALAAGVFGDRMNARHAPVNKKHALTKKSLQEMYTKKEEQQLSQQESQNGFWVGSIQTPLIVNSRSEWLLW